MGVDKIYKCAICNDFYCSEPDAIDVHFVRMHLGVKKQVINVRKCTICEENGISRYFDTRLEL